MALARLSHASCMAPLATLLAWLYTSRATRVVLLAPLAWLAWCASPLVAVPVARAHSPRCAFRYTTPGHNTNPIWSRFTCPSIEPARGNLSKRAASLLHCFIAYPHRASHAFVAFVAFVVECSRAKLLSRRTNEQRTSRERTAVLGFDSASSSRLPPLLYREHRVRTNARHREMLDALWRAFVRSFVVRSLARSFVRRI